MTTRLYRTGTDTHHDLLGSRLIHSGGGLPSYVLDSRPAGAPVFPPAMPQTFTVFYGTNANDQASSYNFLYGYGGHDDLATANTGYGEAYGGNGDDLLDHTSPEAGVLYGGNGSDNLDGSSAGDALYGGTSNDYLFVSSGGAGDNYAEGGDGSDLIHGDGFFYGGAGNDSGTISVPVSYNPSGAPTYANLLAGLYGSTATDHIYGGKGNDRLNGGYGFDILVGGAGRDDLYGSNDGDIFRWESLRDSPKGNASATSSRISSPRTRSTLR